MARPNISTPEQTTRVRGSIQVIGAHGLFLPIRARRTDSWRFGNGWIMSAEQSVAVSGDTSNAGEREHGQNRGIETAKPTRPGIEKAPRLKMYPIGFGTINGRSALCKKRAINQEDRP